ncbi:MAG: hypothetical protein JWN50_824 [Parcubacteria group bacterium]|nr:hypothetical protein [Parcubacteria group bacterium]
MCASQLPQKGAPMFRSTRSFAFAVFAASILALPASAQRARRSLPERGASAVPVQAELDKFPIMPHVLTAAEMARLDLRPVPLDSDRVFFNWNRSIRRFELDTLHRGTIVLIDKNDVVRYKADCGNRLVEYKRCPECRGSALFTPTTLGFNQNPNARPNGSAPLSPRSFLGRISDALRDAAKSVWSDLGAGFGDGLSSLFWLLALLAGLALIPLLLYGLYRLLQERNQGTGSAGVGVTAAPVAPATNASRGGNGGVPAPGYTPVQNPPPRVAAVPVIPVSGSGAAPAQAGTATAVADAPAAVETPAVTETRRFVTFRRGQGDDPHTLHVSGMDHVHYEAHDDGSTTIHVRHA